MVKLTEKELKIIHEKCGSNFAQRYRGIVKRTNDKVVKIVNTGMVSSGKSSLFNILIDSTEEEHFPTGAARTTTVADYFDYKNISFIDTPGIDVRNEDVASATALNNSATSATKDAIDALMTFGFTASEASVAVSKCDSSLPADEIIKQALKLLSKRV